MRTRTHTTGSARRPRALIAAAALLATGLIAALAAPQAASARTLEQARQSGKLIVGISGDNPPYGYVDTSGAQLGFDAEIARAFAKSLGLEVQFSQLSLAARIPSLISQKVDMLIAGLGITPERAKSVQFTVPYLETKMYVVAKKGTPLTSQADLGKYVLGTPRSSTLDVLLSAAAPKDADIRRFDDDSATIQSLLSGQTTAIAANQFALDRLEKLQPGVYENKLQIGSIWFAAAGRPGEKDWNTAFNAFFEKYRQTSEYRDLLKTWTKNDVPQFPTEMKDVSFVAP